ncbi:cysteine--tRNA ligase [Mesorhizobium sp. M4B.F.Ca.ET.215.01.1.1]|uniref:Cysteine--tRNA ligase n=1 Tax=Mesorhizobium abyssinicae TaxID=1209958 RepID=A0ABU5AVK5_9HYPH|nr:MULTISPECIES: cysteine--tRNA ligase [Mesorhizobium]MDX8541308.1 cysteine--tRNA ligase [Mesorhizobium abyssinicae]RUW26524.1 cysteine--tRNA ligase [Mesorhizobium sp. M4B.F.Ca.ET.013.02.1.1]RVD37426.1 cysteine--tRNA ligase [Mesorhizobium sp. M4B.F.Ca.ET.019.03.1.1]RWF66211.1 MAG: cysteine--tRNA ligase [Mesorhizobium sp.]TGQ13169.1 cysteine--tRNA ligase [Mesorhizobium sp. M4B.F.Ca.ET.215.01.1.1]
MSDASKGLSLYNTLTRTQDDFVPIDPQNVRMYVCGPTVYDFAHIGNARPVIVFDVLFRLLRQLYGESHVTYVRNITDVDDKINARALRDFGAEIASGKLSLNEAIRRVTEKTADQYHKDVATLGCLPPTFEPRATEFVLPRPDGKADMITLIERLIGRGHAYQAQGEVLFDTASMPDYGELSKRNLDEQQAGARIAVDAHKKNPGDFVLWKLSSPEEPGWESPWGRGRPGWHIECSAMSAAYLGEVFDIHGGGLDLIFPHHENEIAQSRCAHGTEVMANVWMHNGFLQVEGQKMSKSLGNFYSIHELLETETFGGRKWPGEVLRLAMLMTHYREPIDFSVRKLEEAENTLRKWKRASDLAPAAGQLPAEVVAALSDDLATYAAFQQLTQLAGEAAEGNDAAASLKAALAFLGFDVGTAEVDEAAIAKAIAKRLALIAGKNWAEADRIRDELLAQGVQLKDGKDPVTGERVTTWEIKR